MREDINTSYIDLRLVFNDIKKHVHWTELNVFLGMSSRGATQEDVEKAIIQAENTPPDLRSKVNEVLHAQSEKNRMIASGARILMADHTYPFP